MAFKTLSWFALNRGDEIELLDVGAVIARGLVDGFTDDREIIWLIPSSGEGRKMFHRADGWDVRVVLT